jgi:5-formyltetrahydrofolate cyclo-ligase
MDSKKIARINELYKKQKEGILTKAEREEQAVLRLEYIEAIRANIRNTLDHTSIQEPDGSIHKLRRKDPFR